MHEQTIALCACGCLRPAPIAAKTIRSKGQVKGEPLKYRKGHNTRRPNTPHDYVVEDRGHVTPCWTWQLTTATGTGYGLAKVNGRSCSAHRAVYERLRGPIPEGLELDHLCRNRNCVNPDHLEPVTHLENVRRGVRDSPTWGRPLTPVSIAIDEDLRIGHLSRREIAARHCVSRSYVDMIARGVRGPKRRSRT